MWMCNLNVRLYLFYLPSNYRYAITYIYKERDARQTQHDQYPQQNTHR